MYNITQFLTGSDKKKNKLRKLHQSACEKDALVRQKKNREWRAYVVAGWALLLTAAWSGWQVFQFLTRSIN